MTTRMIVSAYIALLAAPAFFSTNIIFAKLIPAVEPFTLATMRWGIASALLLVLYPRAIPDLLRLVRQHTLLVVFSAFPAFWICGGMVYLATQYTSGTNGVLIFTTPPIFILILEAIFRGRPVGQRETVGILIAIIGTMVIISRGSSATFLQLNFNAGDLIILAAAFSWGVYSVLLKSKPFAQTGTAPLLGLLAAMGTLMLLPFAAIEIASGDAFPTTRREWLVIGAIILFSSLLAFLTFQYGIKMLGAPVAGMFMYLLAPYGLIFANLLLGEALQGFHLAGTVLIIGGIAIATFPASIFRNA